MEAVRMDNIVSIALKGDELNDRFGGGIPGNSLILIEGDNGLGKSVLAQRLLYGLMQHGASATYMSTEMNTAGFFHQMSAFNYDIKKELEARRLLFLSIYPSLGNVFFEKNFMYKIFSTPEIFRNDIIIFDTISHMLLEDNLSEHDNFMIIKYLRELSSLNKIIVFCVNPKQVSERFLDLLRSISDVYLRLESREQYGVIVKLIHIERFTGARGNLSTPIPYKVLAGLGLALEIASSA
jgi:archaeal flagellar protein FlaH